MENTSRGAQYLRTEKAAQWVREKWGEDKPCPYCGDNHWGVDGTLLNLRPIQGGFGYLAFQVICSNCGHTVLVNAVAAGLVSSE